MRIEVPTVALLAALACIVPWATIYAGARRRLFAVLAFLLRLRLQRRHGARIIVYTGGIARGPIFRVTRAVQRTPPTRPIILLLDTTGGHIDAALALARTLAAHPARVTVRVVDECWSAGTIIACAADEIVMAPAANLGPTDCSVHVDRDEFRGAPVIAAAAAGSTDPVDLFRARSALRDIVTEMSTNMQLRGMHPVKADNIANWLTFNDGDHQRAIFPNTARLLGLPVTVSRDLAWSDLVCWDSWSK